MSGPECVRLPSAVAEPLRRLVERGHTAHLVGPCAAFLWSGETCLDYELATDADRGALLALFPHAVPLTPTRLLLPSAAGPIDLLCLEGGDIASALARRDFTRNALALDAQGRVLDPHGGRRDLRAGLLRCVGDPAARLAEDPLRGLRAARLVATLGLRPDAALVAALPGESRSLLRRPSVALRAEVCALLLGAHAGRGLDLLRKGGLEAELAPGVGDDAAAVVDALPVDLELRLAGWLRGARAVRCLRRLRVPRERVVGVERLLQHHPIDAGPATMKRLLRRPPELVDRLFALRSAEIEARGEAEGDRLALEDLRRAVERIREGTAGRIRLALDGRAVMETLGCAPGPEVGRALAWLRKAVEADPHCNTPEALRTLLQAWGSSPKEDAR